jgi:protein phosphatase
LLSLIADGMGGLAYGEEAARAAVLSFQESYRQRTAGESVPEALRRCALAANASVHQMGSTLESADRTGTTLIAAAFLEDQLYWASVGDSGLFLFRGGALKRLNESHVYSRILDQRVVKGEITPEDAAGDPQRDALTSYVGSSLLREIDANTEPFALQEGDLVVLATDGLFKTLTEDEITGVLRLGGGQAAETLVKRVLDRHRRFQDNVTVLIIAAQPPGTKPSPEPPPARQTPWTLLAGIVAGAVLAALWFWFS